MAPGPAGGEPALFTDLFAEQVRRTPHATAVVWGEHRRTYAELDAEANRLAHRLVSLGAGPDRLVAIGIRSAHLVVAALATLKAGAAYLPLDLSYPPQRLEHMLTDARPMLLLTTGDDQHSVPASDAPRVLLDDPDAYAGQPDTDVTDADRLAPLRPADTAYVIYTSGSTGSPKGVVIEHRQLGTYLRHVVRSYPGVRGRALLHSSFAFDLTVTAFYAPLMTGGCVHVGALEEMGTPAAGPFGQERPTFVKVTPSHIPLLTALPAEASPTGELMAGGELLLGETVDAWRRRHPGARVVNEYGPTETTVGCSTVVIEPDQPVPPGPLPIGQPMPDVRFHVLDDELRPVRPGEIGELHIAGAQLARGYLGRPGLTAERFLPDPFGPPGSRMYRSGDRVRPTADGEYEFCGRVDNQAKIRGYRIELGEIEAALLRSPQVRHAAAVIRTDAPEVKQLVAYVVAEADATLDPQQLRKDLAETLPDYMVPSAVVSLAALPLTVNRKLDTAALPAPEVAATPGGRAPADELQALLCELFATYTAVSSIGVDDDFFVRGGTSLGAAQLVNEARRRGLTLSLRDVLENRTVARLAEVCADTDRGDE
ncbi:non-ribosomal peptide synthetase [Micromonospora echinofusca]|uniref:non-ribosomal peptide synthetase n=1 Tax=Micromonospora echinofusca TaxID=47858 RepID=UPI0033D9B014